MQLDPCPYSKRRRRKLGYPIDEVDRRHATFHPHVMFNEFNLFLSIGSVPQS